MLIRPIISTTVLGAALVAGCVVPEPREPAHAGLAVDHVPVAVKSLGEASATYASSLGFTLKEGREHPNGLRNAFAKFADGTYLELISPEHGATDDLTARYVDFLDRQEGARYLFLRADTLAGWISPLEMQGHPVRLGEGRPFSILTFDESRLDWLFLIEYAEPVQDADEVLRHRNTALGIQDVWLEERTFEAAQAVGLVDAVPGIQRGYGGAGGPVTGVTIRVESIETARAVLKEGQQGDWPIREDALGRSIHVPASLAHGVALELRELRR